MGAFDRAVQRAAQPVPTALAMPGPNGGMAVLRCGLLKDAAYPLPSIVR